MEAPLNWKDSRASGGEEEGKIEYSVKQAMRIAYEQEQEEKGSIL